LGRITLWSAGLAALLYGAGSKASGWATFITLVFAFCAFLLIFRWVQRRLMWRLRHRLIVTYIFIGVIPIVLLLLMAALGSYLLAGQFAAYIAISDLQSALRHLDAANDALAAQLSILQRGGKLNEQIAGELATLSGENFPQRTVTVWRTNKHSLSLPEVRSPIIVSRQCLMLSKEISAVSLSMVTPCIYER
jgi:hypothetical protein